MEKLQQDGVVHSVIAGFDVPLDDPVPTAAGMIEEVHRSSKGLVGRAAWPETIREVQKHPFVQRLQDHLHHRLNRAVGDGGNAQWP